MPKIVTLDQVHDEYERLAKDYEIKWRDFIDMPHHWILGYADRPKQILDLGCGTGQVLGMLKSRYPAAKVTGVDCSPAMLEFASERVPDGEFFVSDVEDVELPDSTFDLVLSINVLHHLNDPQGHIDMLHRVCAYGGAVFLCDFAIQTWKLKIVEQYWRHFHPTHNRAFSHDELRALLEDKFTFEQDSFLKPNDFWHLQIYKLRKKK